MVLRFPDFRCKVVVFLGPDSDAERLTGRLTTMSAEGFLAAGLLTASDDGGFRVSPREEDRISRGGVEDFLGSADFLGGEPALRGDGDFSWIFGGDGGLPIASSVFRGLFS